MDEKWVSRLIEELGKPLPGVEAQLRLSPPGRLPVSNKKPPKDSAVLILLYSVGIKLLTVFIKRAEYDGVHSGQVGLPGGMCEITDIGLKNTALRETMEELGVASTQIEIIGSLTSLHIPVSNIRVYPFIGICQNRPDFKPDPHEVRYIIETHIEELLDRKNEKFKIMSVGENDIEIPYFDIRGDHIWGATAMIVSEFLEIVRRIDARF
jgi:8-oxo-dGTP pyrophosphatase MutT (NUDIX family)